MEEAFDQISEELRSQYTLGYYPTNTARDGKFRKIKVDMTDKDMKVLARKGYYAPKGKFEKLGRSTTDQDIPTKMATIPNHCNFETRSLRIALPGRR